MSIRKEKCRALMQKFFGSASAKSVELMSEEEVVDICRAKVAGFIGLDYAKEFDKIK